MPDSLGRAAWYLKGGEKVLPVIIKALVHPGDSYLPQDQRRMSCDLLIQFLYKHEMFVSDPANSSYDDMQNIQTLYSLRAKVYPLEKQRHMLKGGHVLNVHVRWLSRTLRDRLSGRE